MSELNRRDVMRVVAAGTALAGAAAAGGGTTSVVRSQRRAELVRGAVRRALPAANCGLSAVSPATVAMCRSFDGQVLLEVADGSCGLVALEPRGFTVAAAAQAAGRPVMVRYWGHDAAAAGGLGRFAGVLLAFAAEDLVEAEGQP